MTPRSKAEDAERKRQARQKQREAKQVHAAAASRREEFQDKRKAELSRQFAELLAKMEYDDDPQRGVERVDRAVKWLREAEAATGDTATATLSRISRELRSTLNSDYIGCSGGLSIIDRDVMPSWNGFAWLSVGDLRRVIEADLRERGLMEQFEQATKGANPR